jgi:hypothetical protein
LNISRDRTVVGFTTTYAIPSQYNRNIVESGVKHNNPNPDPIIVKQYCFEDFGGKSCSLCYDFVAAFN